MHNTAQFKYVAICAVTKQLATHFLHASLAIHAQKIIDVYYSQT